MERPVPGLDSTTPSAPHALTSPGYASGPAGAGTGPSALVVGRTLDRRETLATLLEAEGFLVSQTSDATLGVSAVAAVELILVEGRPFDEAVRRICQASHGSEGASLVLMADQPDPIEHIIALELGADDLMCWSADPRLLMARVRALLRRRNVHGDQMETQAGWRLNPLVHQAISPRGERIALSRSEMVLFDIFLSRPGEIITAELLKDLGRFDEGSVALRTSISRLRRKLEKGREPVILTVRGAGYVFDGARGGFGRSSGGRQRPPE